MIFAMLASYSGWVRKTFSGFMAKVEAHSAWSLYLGTRWKCMWPLVSP